ncbi:3' exoribonuclease family, domain 1 domain-containing protein [Ditylenchus destructor]|uniref:polyribonucleotide nucleotidyltransferase n=1 Tax=Ditylenchus destructor TaxID=166010 RepID=A0AAD4RAA3_9BILA|nr:3' exoribonuclease family, domain 1 domain-containing protein [Ditylenchus destructor]
MATAWKRVKKLTEVAELSSGPMTFLTGHMARFADGSVELRHKDSSILGTVATAMSKESESSSRPSFLNLTVDCRQSAAAIGRIPTNYLRRELTTDQDTAISRIIDRSARPCFYATYPHKCHIVCKPFAIDDDGDVSVLGVNVASAALAISSIPLRSIFAATRVCMKDSEVFVNPSRDCLKDCDMNLLLTGTDQDKVIMLEMEGKQIKRDKFIECIDKGSVEIRKIIEVIRRLASGSGKEKIETPKDEIDEEIVELCRRCENGVHSILTDYTHDKYSRDQALKEVKSEWLKTVQEETTAFSDDILSEAYSRYVKKMIRRITMETGVRVDGRRLDEVRPIEISVDIAKKLHGSAIFTRGQSQVFATVTFDSPEAAFHSDVVAQLLGAQQRKSFMLSYEFPQFAVGEIAEGRFGANRREIGHALLAEKALKNVLPKDFPYTIRVSSQVLESNGSTSMAAALAGIAIGMLSDENENGENKNYVLLTDLFGMEDHFGEMDFKVAGTTNGFTAMQLDLKNQGLTRDQMQEALIKSEAGIAHILSKMNEAIPKPRDPMKPNVPVIEVMELPPNHRRELLFRAGGYQAKLIRSETGVEITPEEEKSLCFVAPNADKLTKAKEMALKAMKELNDEDYLFGQIYKAEIAAIQENGIMVSLKPGTKPILLRNSDLSNQRIAHASVLGLEVGQQINVRYFGRDQKGFHRITRKLLNTTELPVQSHFARPERGGKR